jgi:hypothetical protein
MKFQLKQQALFYMALQESGVDCDLKDLTIFHNTGHNEYKGERYNVTFPQSFVEKAKALHTTDKTYEYNFMGNPVKHRAWVKEYEEDCNFIRFSAGGRHFPKDQFDANDYYNHIANSKFTLCPAGSDAIWATGEYVWSYRFAEAIMCRSIPIITEQDYLEDKMKGYTFFYSDEEHIYDEEILDRNYELFIERHTLL